MTGPASPTSEKLSPDRGEEILTGELGSLRQRLDAHEESFFTALDELLTHPMREAFSTAYEAHAQLMDLAGLGHAEGGPGEGREAGTPSGEEAEISDGARLRHYREGVRSEVLQPLRAALKEIEVGRYVADRWEGFQNSLPSLADPLPPELVRHEPADLYDTMAEDGGLLRFRKASVRSWRTLTDAVSGMVRGVLNLFSGGRFTPRVRSQHLPLRQLARECLLGNCPQAMEGLLEALQQHYAAPVAGIETAIARWTEDWFSAEDRAYVGGGHLGARFLDALARDFPSSEDPETDQEGSENVVLPGPAEGETGDQAPPEEVLEVWQALEGALATGAFLDTPVHVRDEIQETMVTEWAVMLEEVRVAGSFQSRSGNGRVRRRVDRRAERDNSRGEAWAQWHGQSLERFTLCILLLRLREEWDKTKDGLLGEIVDEVLSPLLTAWGRAQKGLRALEEEAEARFSSASPSDDPTQLAEHVGGLMARGQDLLRTELQDVVAGVDPVQSVHIIADKVANELADTLRFLPETLSIPPRQDEGGEVIPTFSARAIPFREIVQQTVDVLSLEAVRNSPEPLLGFLQGAVAECAEIPTVVSFNLTEARDELRAPPEGPMGSVIEDARSLTVEGLARTAQGVEGLASGLARAWKEFTRETHDLLEGSFREVHARAVAEGTVQEQILDLRSRARSWVRAGLSRGREAADSLDLRLQKYSRLIRARGAKLIELGRQAVGSSVTEEGEGERALVILRGIPLLLNSLPLVYRRLYSFQPLADPALLVGRETELKWISGRLDAWKAGFGAPCVHAGPPGVGHTSFLNALNADLLTEFKVIRVELDQRYQSEDALAARLAKELEISGDGSWTFEKLAPHLSPASPQARPVAIQVEHLEHLLLRTPGGTALLADFLSFQASTHRHAFWISTASSATWKLVEKSDPTAAGLTAHQTFSTFSRVGIEDLIMVRHQRSGLPVEFRQPRDLNPLMRRKLRRSRGDKAKQEILRTEFFDRLYRMSTGSAGAAILLWLRALNFSSKKGWLRVTPPRPIRFAFMEELDPNLDFVLMALMEHRSLTLDEFAGVFDVSHDEAFRTFEALRRRMLVEPLGTRRSEEPRLESVEEGVRYRIPGILSHVVATRLRNRNILH